MDDTRGTRTVAGTNDTTDGDQDQEAEPKRPLFRGCGCWIAVLVVLLLGGGGAATVGGMVITRQEQPLPLETEITDLALRWIAVPAEYTDLRIPRSPNITTAKGRELFQVECAYCHGTAGDGNSPIGRAQYPAATNLRIDRVRTKTDGQLFWIIAHGINLTGMPAWGAKFNGAAMHNDDDIWSLVKFMREEYHGEQRP